MSLTKITERVITPNTIDANSLAENISVGGVGQKVTVNQVIVTDENFANTEDTTISSAGGYVKLYGNNYTTNSNVYLSTTFAVGTQVTANVVSNNEIQVTIGATNANTYNLFVFNEKGKFAFKEDAITSILLQATAGWVAGGNSPEVSSTERVIYSSDTATASLRGNLSRVVRNFAAAGNNNFGWFGGGIPGPVSTVDRITFSSDTGTASVRGSLNLAKSFLTATGSSNFGWFVGGGPAGSTTIERINFSDDTGVASIRGTLTVARREHASSGNEDYGWFGGGYQPALSPGQSSSVERVTYLTDTATASVRGPLTAIMFVHKAVANDNFGWFGGGNSTRVARIDFSSDTSTASARGPFQTQKQRASAADDDNYGWFFAGGFGSTQYSRVDRIDFAADTNTSSLRGPLNIARNQDPAATSGIA
jgi:hypothetical protein